MKPIIFGIVAFGVGCVTGVIAAKGYFSEKYSQIAEEEITSMREYYKSKSEDVKSEAAAVDKDYNNFIKQQASVFTNRYNGVEREPLSEETEERKEIEKAIEDAREVNEERNDLENSEEEMIIVSEEDYNSGEYALDDYEIVWLLYYLGNEEVVVADTNHIYEEDQMIAQVIETDTHVYSALKCMENVYMINHRLGLKFEIIPVDDNYVDTEED